MANNITQEGTITRVGPADLPDFLRDKDKKEMKGIAALNQYVIVPRLKIVQKQAANALITKHGIGALVLSPTGEELVAKPNGDENAGPRGLHFTPLYFFVDWMTINPIALKGSEPMVRYRTTNPNDPIVAKSRTKELRKEKIKHGNNEIEVHHVENLNFVVQIHDSELVTSPVILTFNKAEWFTGSKFSTLIKQRGAEPFACVFKLQTGFRPGKNELSWWGIDVMQPDANVSPWVTKEQYTRYSELYDEFAKLHGEQRLAADMTDTEDLVDPAPEGNVEGM